MTEIRPRPSKKYIDNMDWAIRKLRKLCEKEGLFDELNNRRFFRTKSEKKRLAKKKSTRRVKKERSSRG